LSEAHITEFAAPTPELKKLLQLQVKLNASDLHLVPHSKPRVRVHGSLVPLEDFDALTPEDTKAFANSCLTDEAKKKALEEHLQVDTSLSLSGFGRFRINICDQRTGLALVFRAIPFEPISFEELGIPDSIIDLCLRPYGFILVTGPTGSGKTTTLAAMIDKINRERACHIGTIEDPIEFIHPSKRALVTQREVYKNTLSFSSASKNLVREAPDVALIGELRDLETIEEVLHTAEKGHLTFATLHTNNAASTITRVIDVFPANQQAQIRTQLAEVLIAVISQQLIPRRDGTGRVMALEAMLPNSAIKNLIREGKIHQIQNAMGTGQDKNGMILMNQSLAKLIAEGVVTFEEAKLRSPDPNDLRSRVGLYKDTVRTQISRPSRTGPVELSRAG
jgi:twitching motility protein PilT